MNMRPDGVKRLNLFAESEAKDEVAVVGRANVGNREVCEEIADGWNVEGEFARRDIVCEGGLMLHINMERGRHGEFLEKAGEDKIVEYRESIAVVVTWHEDQLSIEAILDDELRTEERLRRFGEVDGSGGCGAADVFCGGEVDGGLIGLLPGSLSILVLALDSIGTLVDPLGDPTEMVTKSFMSIEIVPVHCNEAPPASLRLVPAGSFVCPRPLVRVVAILAPLVGLGKTMTMLPMLEDPSTASEVTVKWAGNGLVKPAKAFKFVYLVVLPDPQRFARVLLDDYVVNIPLLFA
ncbi:hypothetical protein BDK51DRAFT_39382 [Blyttiomyces helicus]|uniref:Uncharacterized protein n=1 Tax=Blyttiomyces helicus TaxID=388810 RepID=A0A4P9WR68_9FUNG|nr:hypothetical protein BDK51DRAFT_39382 [Blyttiomyces helicus]|eukprot:RKO94348.1 hypothetical protein BDK51DRAFT_39382 [Blyttiomyces helicus]